VTARITFKRSYLKQITMQYLPVREKREEPRADDGKTETVKSYLVSRGNSLRTLTEVYEATPSDTRLRRDHIRRRIAKKFSLTGTSMAMSSVFEYVSNHSTSPRSSSNVKTKYVNTRVEGGKDVRISRSTA